MQRFTRQHNLTLDAAGTGDNSPINAWTVTLLPQPDSPIIPSVS
jgi:hypothetical protein